MGMSNRAGFRYSHFIVAFVTFAFASVLALPEGARAQYAPVSWTQIVNGRNAGGVNLNDGTFGVASDGSGNVVTTGSFEGAFDFGGGTLTSAGTEDIFLVKYNGSSGAYSWSRRCGSTLADVGGDVAVDSNDDVIVVGYFSGSVDFGSGSALSSAGGFDVFVAKYSGSNGNHIWSKRFGDSSNNTGGRLSLDSNDDVFFIARYGGVFLAKLNGNDGSTDWSQTFSGAGANDLVRDTNGSLIVTGSFSSTVNFGGGNLSSAGSTDVFLAKFSDSNGSHVWSKRFGGTSTDAGIGLALDGSNNIVLTGGFRETMLMGADTLVASGGTEEDVFLARLTTSGTSRWSRRFGQPINRTAGEHGNRLAVKDGQTIVMTGMFDSTVNFGGGPLAAAFYPPIGEEDMFIAAYDTTSTHLWSMNIGGVDDCSVQSVDGWQNPQDMEFDGSGALLVAGILDGPPTDFGAGPVDAGYQCATQPAPNDGFVAKYFVPGASVADDNLITCPQGDLDSIDATMDFDDSIDIGTVPAGSIALTGPMSSVNLFGTSAPTASGSATVGNGYTATVTADSIGGCSGGAKVPFNIRVNDAIGRLYLSVFASVISPDFDGDGTVSNGSDLSTIQATYSKCPGQANYNACANFVETGGAGCISLADLSFWSSHQGHSATGDPLFAADAPERSSETSVAFGSVEGAPNRFIVTLEHAHNLRASALEISLEALQLDGWSMDHGEFSGDVVARMRGSALWLYIVMPGGESISGDGIKLGELTLKSAPAMRVGSKSGFELRSGTVITTSATYSATPGPLPQPGEHRRSTAYRNALIGNSPNPFNPTTTIRFSSAARVSGELKIYSATGALVKTLFSGPVTPGEHAIEWTGTDNREQAVVSGVYFCQLRLGSFVDKKKLVLIK